MHFRLCVSLLLLVAAVLVSAQVQNGVISGTVRDKAGAVVAGATVTVKNLDTTFEKTVQTNSQPTGSDYVDVPICSEPWSSSRCLEQLQPDP